MEEFWMNSHFITKVAIVLLACLLFAYVGLGSAHLAARLL